MEVKDFDDAIERAMKNLFDDSGISWDGWPSDNFWLNSFYFLDAESDAYQ